MPDSIRPGIDWTYYLSIMDGQNQLYRVGNGIRYERRRRLDDRGYDIWMNVNNEDNADRDIMNNTNYIRK